MVVLKRAGAPQKVLLGRAPPSNQLDRRKEGCNMVTQDEEPGPPVARPCLGILLGSVLSFPVGYFSGFPFGGWGGGGLFAAWIGGIIGGIVVTAMSPMQTPVEPGPPDETMNVNPLPPDDGTV